MKKLDVMQMENLQGGKKLSCSDALSLGSAAAGIGATFGPIGGSLGLVFFAGVMLSCEG